MAPVRRLVGLLSGGNDRHRPNDERSSDTPDAGGDEAPQENRFDGNSERTLFAGSVSLHLRDALDIRDLLVQKVI